MLGLEGGELDRQIMPRIDVGVDAEIGQALAFLLAHMFGVDDIGLAHCLEPGLGADLVALDRLDRVPQLVVVLDGVLGLAFDRAVLCVVGAIALFQQLGIEEPLLGLGVHVQKGRQPAPNLGQRIRILGIDLFDDRKQPTLFGMVVEDQLGDVHRALRA